LLAHQRLERLKGACLQVLHLLCVPCLTAVSCLDFAVLEPAICITAGLTRAARDVCSRFGS